MDSAKTNIREDEKRTVKGTEKRKLTGLPGNHTVY